MPGRRGFRIANVRRSLLPVLVLLVVFAPPANAVPGALDSSFGTDGWVVTSLGGSALTYASGVAIQSDGKIVVTGSASNGFAVVRYLPNGALDGSFGEDGRVTTSFGRSSSGALAVTAQPDSKLVVVGYSRGSSDASVRMAAARYLADGGLDLDFGGGDGRVVVPRLVGVAFATHVLSDGAILLGGCGRCGEREQTIELVRLTPQGELDAGFGVQGAVQVPGRGHIDVTFDDEAFVGVAFRFGRMKVVRLTLDGMFDATFGGDGIRRYPRHPLSRVASLRAALDASGRTVIAASYFYRPAAVVRLTRSGVWDATFSDDGIAPIDVALDHVCAVATDAGGDVLVGGGTMAGGGSGEDYTVLTRFTDDGTSDAAFGDGGTVVQPGPPGIELTNGCDDLAVQPDGKIVLVTSYVSGYLGRPILVARFQGA